MKKKIVVILGPTAVGKTKYAIHVAKNLDGEILSADSMQIYKYMDIGSAKPTKEELAMVPHHLVGEVDPSQDWTVADYQREAKGRIEHIISKGKLPVVSGGTGLYINSLVYEMDFSSVKEDEELRKELQQIAEREGGQALHDRLKKMDPDAAKRIHPNNIKRLIRAIEVVESTGDGIPPFKNAFKKNGDYDCIIIGLNRDRKVLYKRINERVNEMMKAGLLEEVKSLLNMGLAENNISMKAIGYKELIGYLRNEYDLSEAVRLIKKNSRNYAKRQMTWFRRYDSIQWFDITKDIDFEGSVQQIIDYIRKELTS
ncbi:MAG: tRNA (adenosine(37)-N6)-dimethylallyltransferase MiaA [Bacillota bacterium]|jgi:tRNA dimethylallyltransferase|nr:tRNA (adenosine(37)-N6)-dimethylallyltransferase MiaA [Bacillota bacterium]NLM07773.1 tRNA (adenosine(37)-N6)-dimethylallyltransferase MiaA [Clostridiales Family XIII bacterium]